MEVEGAAGGEEADRAPPEEALAGGGGGCVAAKEVFAATRIRARGGRGVALSLAAGMVLERERGEGGEFSPVGRGRGRELLLAAAAA